MSFFNPQNPGIEGLNELTSVEEEFIQDLAVYAGYDPTSIALIATSGITVTTPTGTINGVNAVFTVTGQPKFVVADGIIYFSGAGYTYGALTVTFDVPPSQYVRAIL